MVGFLGLATYIFTAVFVYLSEKDLEHHIISAKIGGTPSAHTHTPKTPPVLPPIGRTSESSKRSVSFEAFRKDGFVEVDLKRQTGSQISQPAKADAPKDRKKPRMILFN